MLPLIKKLYFSKFWPQKFCKIFHKKRPSVSVVFLWSYLSKEPWEEYSATTEAQSPFSKLRYLTKTNQRITLASFFLTVFLIYPAQESFESWEDYCSKPNRLLPHGGQMLDLPWRKGRNLDVLWPTVPDRDNGLHSFLRVSSTWVADGARTAQASRPAQCMYTNGSEPCNWEVHWTRLR